MLKWEHLPSFVDKIETPRLLLRLPRLADTPALQDILCSEHVRQFLGGPISPGAAQVRVVTMVQTWQDTGRGTWIVCECGKDEAIGTCSLGLFEDEIEVSYMLAHSAWGRGYATEAAGAVIAYGFQALKLERIIGVTQEANQGSQHVLEKLGMRHIRNLWKWDAPQRLYELTQTEWSVSGSFIQV